MKKLYFLYFGAFALGPLCLFGQNRAFLNGGFETPLIDTSDATNISQYFISNNAPSSVSGGRIKEWNTTAPDYNVELRRYSTTVNKGEPSAVGNQHAEINATTVGRLYQNVCLVKGETIGYSFYHRGRKGYDVMEVNLYNATGTTKITTLKTSGDNNTAWKFYSDIYYVNVPSGVYQFSFESISSAGASSEGNLLDEIDIQMAPLVYFSKATYSAPESGVKVPVIKVNGTVPVGGLTVTLDATSLSAVEGTDYTVVKTITIPEGKYNVDSDSFPVAFNVLNDAIKEYDEEVHFTIPSVTNGAVISGGCSGSAIATYTIVDDDVFDAGPDQTVCPGDTIVLTATGGLDPKWNKGVKQGVPFKAPLLAGNYVYTAYDTLNINYTNNLVVNGDFSAGNTGFVIDSRYTYNPNYDPSFSTFFLATNQYSILPNPKGTNPNFYNMTDHSGTDPSYMLAVDGYAFPNVSFWYQTFSVIPHTDYRFTAWFASIGDGSPADIQMYANGAPLGTHLPIPASGGWVPYVYTWNSGTNTSVVIRAVDLNIQAVDNDFAMDDVYFGPIDPFQDSLKVTVKSVPLPVVKDVDTCQQVGLYSLTANGTGLKWYNDTLPGSVGSATAPVLDLNTPDTLSKWVTQMVNGCESRKAEIKIAIRALPKAPTVQNLDTCQTTGIYALKAAGTNLKWYNLAIGGIASTTTPTRTLNTPDTINYWASQTKNGCEGPRATLLFQVNPTPLAPMVRDTVVCQQVGTYALTAIGTGLKWYNDTLPASVGSNTAPIINLIVPDTLSKWVSQLVNGCESKKAEIKVAIKPLPAPPSILNLDTCQTTGTYSLKAIGANLKWYNGATGGLSKVITPTLPLSIPDTTSQYVSQTVNGCEGPRASLLFQVNPTPLGPLVRDTMFCQKLGTYSLTAIGPNLKWYNDTLSASTGSSTAPSINLNVIGMSSKWVSQTVNGCESKRAEIQVAIGTLPIAPTTKNLDTCQIAGTYSLKATGVSLKWYTTAIGGNAATITPILDLTIPDTTSQWVSQTVNGCEGPRAMLMLQVNPAPNAPLVNDTVFCQQPGTYTLAASGVQLKWYTTASSGTGKSVAPSFNLNIPDTLTSWVSQTANGCEGPRASLLFQVNPIPSAPLVRDTSLCQQLGSITLSASGTQLKWYDAASAGNIVPLPVFSTSVADTITVWVSQTVHNCEGSRSKTTLTIKTTPGAPLSRDTSLCQKTGTLSFKATGVNLRWYPIGSVIGTALTPSVNTDIVQTTRYLVSQTFLGCEGPKALDSIQIRPVPAVPIVTNQELCQAIGNVSYLAAGNQLQWYSSATATTFSTTTPTENRNNPGTYKMFVSQIQNNCESLKQEVGITIDTLPLPPNVADAPYCLMDMPKPLTTLPDSLFWYTVATGGTSSSIIPVPSTQMVGVTNYWVSAIKKGCEGPRKAIKVTVSALPVVSITGTPSGSYCAKSTLAFAGSGANQYVWKLPSGASLSQTTLTLSSFSTQEVGKYVVTGTDLQQCSAKDSVTITLKNPPAVSATSISICEKQAILVVANTTGTAYWKLPGSRVQNSATLSIPISSYSDNGNYVVVSTQNGCTDSSNVMITVSNCRPVAKDDHYVMFCDETLQVNASNHPILNDFDPNDSLVFEDFSVISSPRFGKVSLDSKGFWNYVTNGEVEATEVLEYQICDKGIPVLCATAKIEIEIKKRDAFFPDAFTPNGDGVNDTYTVYNLSPHLRVDISIFNRWGDLVYQNSDYKNDWRGTCTGPMCLGSELPVGTYYVSAQLSNGYKHTTYLTLSR